jgi:hypothetical protein
MTVSQLESIVRGIAPAISQRIKQTVARSEQALSERLTDLELRIAKVENRKGVSVTYEGTYEHERSYGVGSLVTRRGGLWLALRDTSEVPGSGTADHWRLVVKSGEA